MRISSLIMIKLVIPIQKQLKLNKDTTIINIYYWIIILIHQAQTYLRDYQTTNDYYIYVYFKSRKVGILDLLAIKKYHQKIYYKMSKAMFKVPTPVNEKVKEYKKDSEELKSLLA